MGDVYTNADHIRAMTDEELAETCLCGLSNGSCPPEHEVVSGCSGPDFTLQKCVNCWFGWLKQDYKGEIK